MIGVGAIALVVPPLLIVNTFRILANDWFVKTEITQRGLPADRYGLTTDERLELALVGLRAIQPSSEGIRLLERATLPDGSPAFDGRELRHMGDVRRLLGWALRAQIVAFSIIVALAVGLRRSTRWRLVVPRGLLLGGLGMLGVAALAVPVILLGFDGFFLGFHTVFFEGASWRFSATDTLLRIYPEIFWRHTSQIAAGLAVGQAVVLVLASFWWLRRSTGERAPSA